jgi:hypothetical protein
MEEEEEGVLKPKTKKQKKGKISSLMSLSSRGKLVFTKMDRFKRWVTSKDVKWTSKLEFLASLMCSWDPYIH